MLFLNFSGQTPLVAKVLTNAAGQVISVESLLAHQKQHGSLPQGLFKVFFSFFKKPESGQIV